MPALVTTLRWSRTTQIDHTSTHRIQHLETIIRTRIRRRSAAHTTDYALTVAFTILSTKIHTYRSPPSSYWTILLQENGHFDVLIHTVTLPRQDVAKIYSDLAFQLPCRLERHASQIPFAANHITIRSWLNLIRPRYSPTATLLPPHATNPSTNRGPRERAQMQKDHELHTIFQARRSLKTRTFGPRNRGIN